MENKSDLSEVERLLRSAPCQKLMADIRQRLRQRWIQDVSFHARQDHIAVRLTFHMNDPPIYVLLPELSIPELRRLTTTVAPDVGSTDTNSTPP
jgi:hypothetical protein